MSPSHRCHPKGYTVQGVHHTFRYADDETKLSRMVGLILGLIVVLRTRAPSISSFSSKVKSPDYSNRSYPDQTTAWCLMRYRAVDGLTSVIPQCQLRLTTSYARSIATYCTDSLALDSACFRRGNRDVIEWSLSLMSTLNSPPKIIAE